MTDTVHIGRNVALDLYKETHPRLSAEFAKMPAFLNEKLRTMGVSTAMHHPTAGAILPKYNDNFGISGDTSRIAELVKKAYPDAGRPFLFLDVAESGERINASAYMLTRGSDQVDKIERIFRSGPVLPGKGLEAPPRTESVTSATVTKWASQIADGVLAELKPSYTPYAPTGSPDPVKGGAVPPGEQHQSRPKASGPEPKGMLDEVDATPGRVITVPLRSP